MISKQYSATIWPYLTVEATYDVHALDIDLNNDGLGPALVKSASLSLNGQRLSGWAALLRGISKNDPVVRAGFLQSRKALRDHRGTQFRITASTLGPGSTIRPGETKRLFSISLPASIPASRLSSEKVAIEFCYCSLDQRCWTLARSLVKTIHPFPCRPARARRAIASHPSSRW